MQDNKRNETEEKINTIENNEIEEVIKVEEIKEEVMDCIEIISNLYKKYVEVIPNGKDLQADLDKYVMALNAFMDEELKAA